MTGTCLTIESEGWAPERAASTESGWSEFTLPHSPTDGSVGYGEGAHLLTALLVGFVIMQGSTLATSVYMHRCLTHKALTIHPYAAIPLRAIIWLTTGMKAREWAAVHRRHHAAMDTAEDPHSPAVLGFWKVQLTNAYLYQRAIRNREQVARYSRDIVPDRLDRVLFAHAWLGPLGGIPALVSVVGWRPGPLPAARHPVLYVTL